MSTCWRVVCTPLRGFTFQERILTAVTDLLQLWTLIDENIPNVEHKCDFFSGCLAFWCPPCFSCKTAHEAGECVCLPLLDSCGLIPPIGMAVRVSIRQQYGIEVQICVILKHFGLNKKHLNCVNAFKHSVDPDKSHHCLIGLSDPWSVLNLFMHVPRQHPAIHAVWSLKRVQYTVFLCPSKIV